MDFYYECTWKDRSISIYANFNCKHVSARLQKGFTACSRKQLLFCAENYAANMILSVL